MDFRNFTIHRACKDSLAQLSVLYSQAGDNLGKMEYENKAKGYLSALVDVGTITKSEMIDLYMMVIGKEDLNEAMA